MLKKIKPYWVVAGPLTLLLLAWLWVRERNAAEDAHWAYDEAPERTAP